MKLSVTEDNYGSVEYKEQTYYCVEEPYLDTCFDYGVTRWCLTTFAVLNDDRYRHYDGIEVCWFVSNEAAQLYKLGKIERRHMVANWDKPDQYWTF